MSDLQGSTGPQSGLDAKSDDELRSLASEAQEILKKREAERQKKAIEEINKIAKDHGLVVDVQVPGKPRRGRPRKKAPEEKDALL